MIPPPITDEADALHCLYVEDDPNLRDLVTWNLALEGITVHLAVSGVGVEQVAATLCPDVVLLDVMLPGRDGISVLGGLRANPATAGIPVVLLSAKAGDADIWEGWKQGADLYLTKPFDVTALGRHLRRVHRAARSAQGLAPGRP